MPKNLVSKIPNYLTILRIALVIPFIVFMALTYSQMSNGVSFSSWNIGTTYFLVSGIIFTVAMITDYIDGYVARKYKAVSTFGKLFDPLADKLMTSSALVLLSVMQIVPFWITIIFIIRDILVDGARNLFATKGHKIEASVWGKAKTMLMSIGIVIVFFIYPAKHFGVYNVNSWNWDIIWLNLTIIASAVLSIISGYQYLIELRKYLKF